MKRSSTFIIVLVVLSLVGITAVFTMFIMSSATLKECETLGTQKQKDMCYNKAGIETQNPALCENIVGNDMMITGQPRDYCYMAIARATKNEKLCEKVSDQPDTIGWNNRNACYTEAAGLKKNITLCEKITVPAQKETCTRSVTAIMNQ